MVHAAPQQPRPHPLAVTLSWRRVVPAILVLRLVPISPLMVRQTDVCDVWEYEVWNSGAWEPSSLRYGTVSPGDASVPCSSVPCVPHMIFLAAGGCGGIVADERRGTGAGLPLGFLPDEGRRSLFFLDRRVGADRPRCHGTATLPASRHCT